MIFVMSLKQFMNKKKKLVEPKEYLIIDSSNAEQGDLKKFAGTVTVDGFNPPKKLLIEREKDDKFSIEIDEDKIAKFEKKYFKGKEFTVAVMGAIKALIESNRPYNVFIVMRNKAYKHYGTKIAKKMKKMVDVDFDFVYTYDELDENKKLLKKDLKKDNIEKLGKRLKKMEKELQEDDK